MKKDLEERGQSAIEFLTTYGWAILVALIVIGALAYFGVFTPENFVSNSIIANPPFGVTQEVSINSKSIDFVLRNGGSEKVNISSIGIAGCGKNNTNIIMEGGVSRFINIVCDTPLKPGDKFRTTLEIEYRTGDELLNLTSSGVIIGRIAYDGVNGGGSDGDDGEGNITYNLSDGLFAYYNFSSGLDLVSSDNNLIIKRGNPQFVQNSDSFPLGDGISGFCPDNIDDGWNVNNQIDFGFDNVNVPEISFAGWMKPIGRDKFSGRPLFSKGWFVDRLNICTSQLLFS